MTAAAAEKSCSSSATLGDAATAHRPQITSGAVAQHPRVLSTFPVGIAGSRSSIVGFVSTPTATARTAPDQYHPEGPERAMIRGPKGPHRWPRGDFLRVGLGSDNCKRRPDRRVSSASMARALSALEHCNSSAVFLLHHCRIVARFHFNRTIGSVLSPEVERQRSNSIDGRRFMSTVWRGLSYPWIRASTS